MYNGIIRDIVSCPAIDMAKSAIPDRAGEREMLLLHENAYTPLFAELCGASACRATREQSGKDASFSIAQSHAADCAGGVMDRLTTPTIDASKFDALARSVGDPIKLELLQLTLSAGVPLAIHDLQKQGGPSEWHFAQAREFAWDMGEHGDALLYRMKGETARMMSRLIEVVAVLAFCPGGITTFGLHFEAESEVAQ